MILNGPTPRAPEAERYFVACALLDPGGLDDLDPPVRPEHFQDGWLRRCFEAVEALRKASAPVNPVSVYDAMRRLGEHDSDAYRIACTTDTVVELSESVPTSANLAYYASEVLGAHVSRRLAVVAHQIGQLAQHSAKPAREKLDEAEQLLLALTTDNSERVQLTTASQLSDLVYEHLRRVTRLDQQSGVRTGLEALDDILAGLQPGELTLIAARPSQGKAQSLDAKVLTPTGWRRMGDLRAGDELASVDGAPSRVLAIHPRGRRKIYRLTLSDGRAAEACAEHLWRVWCKHWNGPRVLSTAEVARKLQAKRYQGRMWLERHSGEWGRDQGLSVHPWLLGVILGDGTIAHTVTVANPEPEIHARIRQLAPCASVVSYSGKCEAVRIATPRGQPNLVLRALRELGLGGCRSWEKFVPENYMRASKASRLALLRGLLDTDGSTNGRASCEFTSTSQRLAGQVCELARGLGYIASCRERARPFHTYKGERRDGRRAWRVRIRGVGPEVFWLPRKASQLTRLDQQARLTIAGVEPAGHADTQCIEVSHPARLYVTDQHVVTHNTALASNILRRCAQEGERVVFISLETPARQLGINWLAAKAYVDTRRLRDGTLDVHGDRLPAKVVDRLYEIADVGDHLTIADRGVRTVGDVRRLARRAQRNGCSIVCVDYLQLLTDDVRHRNSYDEVSAISRQLKAIAVDCGLHVLALAQLNRANEERTSKRPRMSDLRGSGQLEQDADAIVLVHRPHYYDTKADPQLCELIVAKNRNGPTGTAKVRFLRQFNLMKPYEDHANKEGEAE